MSAETDIIDQAVGWHVRLAEASDADWVAFVAWLEADAAHAAAYDVIAGQDRLIGEARFPEAKPEPDAANDNTPKRWPWLIGGTAAAAVLAALIVPSAIAPRTSSYQIATRAGERRTVTLPDGTVIEMSGGTALTFDRATPRVTSLDRGEAVFHVRHDDKHPFVMTAGGVTIRDLGTVFNVAREGGDVSTAVSEGSVLFQPDREAADAEGGRHGHGAQRRQWRGSPYDRSGLGWRLARRRARVREPAARRRRCQDRAPVRHSRGDGRRLVGSSLYRHDPFHGGCRSGRTASGCIDRGDVAARWREMDFLRREEPVALA